jgi:hypothetical protein
MSISTAFSDSLLTSADIASHGACEDQM